MAIAAIHQPQYLPYLGFFHKLFHSDIFIVMDDVEFLRRGLQHRNKIKTCQGEQWLTVPVLHQQNQLIQEVKINTDFPWLRKHWHTILTNYSSAPYFKHYAPSLQPIFEQDWQMLSELNMVLIQWVMEILEIHKPIVYSSCLQATGYKSDRLIRLCQLAGADTYLSGPGGRDYIDLSAFAAADIRVIWQEFSPPSYTQLFPKVGFVPNLSILDVLFCCGPDTRQFLFNANHEQHSVSHCVASR